MSAKDLNLLMLKDGSKPYAENASGDVLSTFNRAVLGQLLLTGSDFELVPGLLSRWKWSSTDGSYELFINENLTFHDGTNVSAADLEFALLRGFFSNQRSFYEIYLGNILGVDKIKPGTKYTSGVVEGVQITGSHSVKVKLKNPNPSFLYALTRPYFSFAKKSALNDDLITWKKYPIGAGSYLVDTEDHDKVVLIKRNSNTNGPNKINIYKGQVSGVEYDISFYPITSQSMEVYQSKYPSAIYTLFFTNKNLLSRLSSFRKAIKYGVDRSVLVEGDKLSRPAFEFLPSSFWKNDSSVVHSYNLSKAKSYFSKIPEELRKKTWKIPVYSFGEFSDSRKAFFDKLQNQFFQFGFKAKFYPNSEKFLSLETAKESPMAYSGRICNNADPLLMFSSFRTKSPYRYDNSQNDIAYDNLFDEAAKAVATEDRVATLRKLSKYTIDHDFMVPIYENDQAYFYNPKSIESFGEQPNVTTLFLDEIILKK